MSIARDINRSQKHLERQLGKPAFNWNGADWPCVANAAAAGKNLGPGGFSPEADLILFVRDEVFGAGSRPQPAQKLIYDLRTYRIETVSVLPGRGLLRLACVDANRKL